MERHVNNTSDDEFVNYMPAMPNLSEDSRVNRLLRRLF